MIEDLYDLKTNKYGNIPKYQKDRLEALLRSGTDKCNRVKVAHSRYRYDPYRKGVAINPKFSQGVKFAGVLAAVYGFQGNVFAMGMVRSAEHERQFEEVVMHMAKVERLSKSYSVTDTDKTLAVWDLDTAMLNYLDNYTSSFNDKDKLDGFMKYYRMGSVK